MRGDETGLARLSRGIGYVEARMTRVSWRRPHQIWSMLTEPARLALWLAPGRIEPRVGGAARLNYADPAIRIESRVSACDVGRMLEFSWSRSGEPLRPVRWTLGPAGVGARLTLEIHTPETEDAARACAGWEARLDMLEAALDGEPIDFPLARFRSARDAYRPRVAELLVA